MAAEFDKSNLDRPRKPQTDGVSDHGPLVGPSKGIGGIFQAADTELVVQAREGIAPSWMRPVRQEFPPETPVAEIPSSSIGTPLEVCKVTPIRGKEKENRPDPAVVQRARAIIGDTSDLSREQKIVLNMLLDIAQQGRTPTESDYNTLEYVCAQWEPRRPAYAGQGIDNLLSSARKRLGEHEHLIVGGFADLDGEQLADEQYPQIDLSALSPAQPEKKAYRTAEQVRNDQINVHALLGTGLTDQQIADKLHIEYGHVRYAKQRLEREAVTRLFEESGVIGRPLAEQEAALQGAKGEFARQLKELAKRRNECTYSNYGSQYQEKARNVDAEIQRLKGDPYYTGVVNALRRMPVSDSSAQTVDATTRNKRA